MSYFGSSDWTLIPWLIDDFNPSSCLIKLQSPLTAHSKNLNVILSRANVSYRIPTEIKPQSFLIKTALNGWKTSKMKGQTEYVTLHLFTVCLRTPLRLMETDGCINQIDANTNYSHLSNISPERKFDRTDVSSSLRF